jgi:hypothetical protein
MRSWGEGGREVRGGRSGVAQIPMALWAISIAWMWREGCSSISGGDQADMCLPKMIEEGSQLPSVACCP